jgi:chorismate mutase
MTQDVRVRGVRGATTADANTREAIVSATRELVSQLIAANNLQAEDVASAIFTMTADLNAEYPAVAARTLGWNDVALLCAHEINVPQSVPRCIRVLIHWNTNVPAGEIQHVYLKGAVKLRPDRVKSV